ncbi:MAG: HD-GYP domain-containing protein [Actinobacteria bacterium]|nr:HD-GYP domain-containing protein [Actinomycetota bacterium]MBV8562067.1 HD-GYP domain-containing protein [Actinomycetota bacterium]
MSAGTAHIETRGDPNGLISLVAATAAAVVALTASQSWHAVGPRPWTFLMFCGLALALQLTSVEVYERGSMSFSSTGLIAIGIEFNAGAALIAGVAMGVATLVARRGRLNRGVFDSAQLGLAAGGSAAVYDLLARAHHGTAVLVGPAAAAGAVYLAINVGLLSLAMGMAEGRSVAEVWKERFRWRTPYYVVSGLLALAVVRAYDSLGLTGLLAFALPPLMMMVSVRQYVSRTRASVEEVREANEELRATNEKLAERNDDLQALFQFAGGLAAHSHDSIELIGYAERALSKLTGAQAGLTLGENAEGIGLVAGGKRIAAVDLEQAEGFDEERWNRLRDALLPQLATALESAQLVEEVRRRHLATIAALSRSMEAKDYYTGGHTERVADVAVAIGRRLGFEGADLDAIEVGALLHDIGKIGIPEGVLHKPGPLDDEEWALMKKHPVISDYILSEVDLHPFVRQIARWSHERIDGQGYPDKLAGDDIPIPARVVLVADALDALTSDRPYRKGRSLSAALVEMREHTGTQFCPTVMAALERAVLEEPELFGEPRIGDASQAFAA